MSTPIIFLISSAGCWALFFVFLGFTDADAEFGFPDALAMISVGGALVTLGIGIGLLIQNNIRTRRSKQWLNQPQLPSRNPLPPQAHNPQARPPQNLDPPPPKNPDPPRRQPPLH